MVNEDRVQIFKFCKLGLRGRTPLKIELVCKYQI